MLSLIATPNGAVIWVELDPATEKIVLEQNDLARTAGGLSSRDALSKPIAMRRVAATALDVPAHGGEHSPDRRQHPQRALLPSGGPQHHAGEDVVGGSNQRAAGQPITVRFNPGDTVETAVDGEKMILRERSAVRRFFDLSKAQEGDAILFERIANRNFRVSLALK